MKHARDDYNRIQDPACLIPADEPVFLIRGQDITGPKIVREWARLADNQGASDAIVNAAMRQADAMEAWQRDGKWKVPDLPACDCASPNGILHDVSCSTGLGASPVVARPAHREKTGTHPNPKTSAKAPPIQGLKSRSLHEGDE